MKTNINLPKDDKCVCCNNKCPDNIYECDILNKLIVQKKSQYIWQWTLKE